MKQGDFYFCEKCKNLVRVVDAHADALVCCGQPMNLLKSHTEDTGKEKHVPVIVAEGDKTGQNVFELAKYVDDNLKEYESRVVIVGHIQRGGTPTTFDRVLASRLGVKAVEAMLDGKRDIMVGFKNNKVEQTSLEDAINLHRTINKGLIDISDILTT